MQGRMKPETAYAFIDAIRVAFDVGALGLGVTDQIGTESSLYTTVTVESFCSLLAFIVFVHETVNLIKNRFFDKDDTKENAYPLTEHSTYLFFRMSSIVASLVGISMIVADLAEEGAVDVKASVGTMLVAVGIFASRALSGSQPKEIRKPRVKDVEAAPGERSALRSAAPAVSAV